jgi:hypothetical protein
MKPGLNRRENRLRSAGLSNGLSRMKGNFHVRFLGEGVAAMPLPYPTYPLLGCAQMPIQRGHV